MVIKTDTTYLPYEFSNKHQCFKYIKDRCQGLDKALRKIEKDSEHLRVRCPLSGDYLTVFGSEEELAWLDNELSVHNLYRS